MVYTDAQLDYPVQNMLDHTWKIWLDDVGEDTLVSSMLTFNDCYMILGNPWCDGRSGPSDYNLCNDTWQAETNELYCNDEALFNTATIGDVVASQVWDRDDPDVGRGMEVLWYTSMNMLAYQPTQPSTNGTFYMYIANSLNSTEGMNVVHDALYSRRYADLAAQAGFNFTVYYTDYNGMSPTEDQRVGDGRGTVS
mmetsp:Transcript_76185/g.217618  ORF Transcript_76185/g.217618 Transcript_76185/m.217618 type:complete len:195 (-) Transcript_76185:98-682(-)